jgi:S-adenosylmethionine synthetase
MKLVSSESVTEGHPDKICDQISDAILDACLEQDRNSRVAIETMVTPGLVHIGGELSTRADFIDVQEIARDVLSGIGNSASLGLPADSVAIISSINKQSPEIAKAVDGEELGAGDQGMMFGYATTETPELMPMPITIAHAMSRKLAELRKEARLPYLRPDAKTQIVLAYVDGKPSHAHNIVISTQHAPSTESLVMQAHLDALVVRPTLERYGLPTDGYELLVNPSGSFVAGGATADAGLTGRKIIVDTYGGAARHGGGAFSGKDPTKVDRSAAYAMRWVAKNLVAASLAERVEVQVAYAIGRAEPVGFYVDSFGTGARHDEELAEIVQKVFDLRPAQIIKGLDLLKPIYRHTTVYGHFGKSFLPWEQINKVDELVRAAL